MSSLVSEAEVIKRQCRRNNCHILLIAVGEILRKPPWGKLPPDACARVNNYLAEYIGCTVMISRQRPTKIFYTASTVFIEV